MRKNNAPEAKVENALAKMIHDRGGLCYKFISPDNPGVPDRLRILPDGKIIFIELKAEFGRMQNIQKWQHDRMLKCRADVRTIRGMEQAKALIKELFPHQN